MQTIPLRSSSSRGTSTDSAAPEDVWIDLQSGDEEGRRWLEHRSELDDQIVQRLLHPPTLIGWRRFGEGFHFNIRVALPGTDALHTDVVDFGIWLEPGRVVTVRRSPVPPLDAAAEACRGGSGPESAWGLIAFALSEVVDRLERNLDEIAATIDALEDEILTGRGELPIQRLSELQVQLVHARRFRVPLSNLVGFMSAQPTSSNDPALQGELQAILESVALHQELLGLSIERASALQSQIRDQIADSMNSATYRFTWVATVFLPLSFITGLLGINVAGIPGDHDPLAFWLVCAGLCVIAAIWGLVVGRATRPSRLSSVQPPKDRHDIIVGTHRRTRGPGGR